MINSVGMREDIHIAWSAIDDPYERLYYIAKEIFSTKPEATFYDLFNYIREEVFRGLPYDEESDFIRNIDHDIQYEITYNKKRK